MKKIVFFLQFLLFAASAHAQTDDLRIVDSNGNAKSQFNRDESVYIEGSCAVAQNQNVKIFVPQNRNDWAPGTDLTDFSGGIETISVPPDTIIPRQIIWSSPLNNGTYDVIIDVNNNFILDAFENCIVSSSGIGFTVGTPTVAPPPPPPAQDPSPTPPPPTTSTQPSETPPPPPPPSTSATFTKGARVEVKDLANVRTSAGGSLIGKQEKGALGLVTNGPVSASIGGAPSWFWNINFDEGDDGWVAEQTITKSSKPLPKSATPTTITGSETATTTSEVQPQTQKTEDTNKNTAAVEPAVEVNVLGGLGGAGLIALAIVASSAIITFGLRKKRE